MKQLRKKSVEAHDALLGYDVTRWCRAFFNHASCCEDPTNNISETFNAWIRKERCLPIISMCESISDRIMGRRAEFYNSMLAWKVDIAPYPFQRLKRRVEDAKHCEIVWDGHHSFRVKDKRFRTHHVVEMIPKTCTCGYWQLTGVPCAHVVRCVQDKGLNEEDFVSAYLKKGMYRLAYERPIECTRGEEMWADYDGPPLEPPVFKRRPGRPKKNRIRSKGEVKSVPNKNVAKLGRQGTALHCSNCDKQGHNRRTCGKQKTTPTSNDSGGRKSATSKLKRKATDSSTQDASRTKGKKKVK